VDTVLAIAGRDTASSTIIVKAVNTSPDPSSITMTVEGAGRLSALGQAIVLTSPRPTDENSFEVPNKIVPVTSTLRVPNSTFTRVLPGNSLTILRLPYRK
jgi:alpha-N-arabinofuranosidase